DAGRPSDRGACALEQEPVRDAGGADRLAGAAAEAAVDVRAERVVVGREPALDDGAHEIEPAARRVTLVAETGVGRAGVETEAAVHTREQSGFLAPQLICRSARELRHYCQP